MDGDKGLVTGAAEFLRGPGRPICNRPLQVKSSILKRPASGWAVTSSLLTHSPTHLLTYLPTHSSLPCAS